MAVRGSFGGGTPDSVEEVGAGGLVRRKAATCYCWSAKTGSVQYTDLLLDGVAVTTIPAPASGQVPEFQGPPDVFELWISAGLTGERVRMTAREPIEDDANVADKVTNGTLTKAALSATYATARKPEAHGAVGNGTADDTTAVQAAVTAWVADIIAGKKSVLLFEQGKTYKVTSKITATLGSAGGFGGVVEGWGATLAMSGASVGGVVLEFTQVGAGRHWKGLTLNGLTVTGGGVLLRAGNDNEFVYNATINNLRAEGAKTVPCLELAGVFESQVTSSYFEYDPSVTPSADAQSAIYVRQESGKAQPSSIDLLNNTTRGGYVGIRVANGADTKIIGGTILAAQHEAIFVQCQGFVVDGVHCEDNWLAASPPSDSAQIHVEGAGRVGQNLVRADTAAAQTPYTGTSTPKYAVRAYAYGVDTTGSIIAGTVLVERVSYKSNVSGAKLLHGSGQAGSILVRLGIPTGECSLNAITGGGRHVGVNDAGTTTDRPSASAAGTGTAYYDTTLGLPVWSDGSNWVESFTRLQTSIWLPASALVSANGAPATQARGGVWPVWLLDQSSSEGVAATIRIPTGWNTFNIVVHGVNCGPGTGDVVLRALYGVHGDGDDVGSGFTTGADQTLTAAASNIRQALTLASGITVNSSKVHHIRVDRQATAGGDTLANDYGIDGIELVRAS